MNPLFYPKLILFGVLSVADFVLTWELVEQTGGAVYESNPIAQWWLSHYGWFGLAGFKFLVVSVFAGLVMKISSRRPRIGGRILTFGCSAVAAVVFYSCILAGELASEW